MMVVEDLNQVEQLQIRVVEDLHQVVQLQILVVVGQVLCVQVQVAQGLWVVVVLVVGHQYEYLAPWGRLDKLAQMEDVVDM